MLIWPQDPGSCEDEPALSRRYIRSERSVILINFCLSIISSNALILIGQTQTRNKVYGLCPPVQDGVGGMTPKGSQESLGRGVLESHGVLALQLARARGPGVCSLQLDWPRLCPLVCPAMWPWGRPALPGCRVHHLLSRRAPMSRCRVSQWLRKAGQGGLCPWRRGPHSPWEHREPGCSTGQLEAVDQVSLQLRPSVPA